MLMGRLVLTLTGAGAFSVCQSGTVMPISSRYSSSRSVVERGLQMVGWNSTAPCRNRFCGAQLKLDVSATFGLARQRCTDANR